MQAKDLEDIKVLGFMYEKHPKMCFMFDDVETSLFKLYPGVPYKVMLAKMRSLIKRGLVGGCACGCRGDFYLTEKGLERVSCE